MSELQKAELKGGIQKPTIFSTKKLTHDQLYLFDDTVSVMSEDFIKINPNRIPPATLKKEIRNVIITSQNAVDALLKNVSSDELRFKNIYCVGRKTKRLIESQIGPVKHSERSAKKLANYLIEYVEGLEVTFFCGNLRLDDLPRILKENHIRVNELEVYETKYSPVEIDNDAEGILFFSPSAVSSFLLKNTPDKIAYCIGETTAMEARKHFEEVLVAKIPTTESVVDLVNENYKSKIRK